MAENPPNDPKVLKAAVHALWERFQQTMFGRLESIEKVYSGSTEDSFTHEQRVEARNAAHKLAGSLGTFGLGEGSKLALELEGVLEGETPLSQDDHCRLMSLAQKLRKEMERGPTPQDGD
jgi:HPt (histidine-containing phosphotransfer) domain-containing protein